LRDSYGRYAEGIILAFVGGALLAGYLALSKDHVKTDIDASVVVLVACGLAGLGLLVGLLVSEGGSHADHDEIQSKLAEIKPKYDATSSYVAHFRNALTTFRSGELVLPQDSQEWDDPLSVMLCDLPATLIEEATDHTPGISLWLETKDSQANPHFEVVADANHSHKEIKKFAALPVENTWLSYAASRQRSDPSNSPVSGRNLADSDDGSLDLKVFKSMEYLSVRVFSVDIGGACLRLVALSKDSQGFSATEDLFFLLLWCVLKIAAGIMPSSSAGGGPTAIS
jgi:hypothetical protein